MYCPKCGSLLPDDANFCDNCGNRVGGELQNAADTPQSFDFTAQGSAGEAALGTLGAVESGAPAPEGPVRVVGSGFKSLFTSIGAAFKNPKKLIPAFILAGVWLTLNILRAFGIEPLPTRMLSFLTFANAGTSGGIAGAVGGIVGKGVFAYALVSLIGLFTRKGGEKRRFADTLKGAFGVTLETLWAYLCGIGAAMLLYLFISGGATRVSFMGGIAASFLAAKAALNTGFIRRLLGSFTKSKSPSHPNVSGLIRGLSVGFAASALIGLSGVNLILVITGSVLLVGGIVMMILQATGVVKLGKEAKVQ